MNSLICDSKAKRSVLMDLVQSSRSRRTLRADDIVDYFEAALHMKSADGLVKVCQTLKNLDAKRGNVTSSNLAMAPKKTKVKRLYLQMDAAFMLF